MATTQTERKFLITLTVAQDDMLNRLSAITERSKAYLMREALNQLLGAYREMLVENDDVRSK